MLDQQYFASLGLGKIHQKVLDGVRLTREDGLALFNCPNPDAVGALGLIMRLRLHGKKAYFVVNRQINYTNICVNDCVFCAFRRDHVNENGAFLLSHEEILKKVAEAMPKQPGNGFDLDELHIVGGCHPDLNLEWFETLLAAIRSKYPDLPIKAFTPVEIAHFSRVAGITWAETLQRLKNAGLNMLPGGGAEIFASELREKICPKKANADQWLEISGTAHRLGLKTNCTMLFGHLETYAQRIDHLCRLREQQDSSGGFTCFIPLPFLKRNSRLLLPEERRGPVDGIDQLKTIAISRLMLDNIPHIKAYWVMLGVKVAQTALWYGADDLDGTILEEHIGHMAGAPSAQAMTIRELEHMIRASGFEPRRRNATFELVEGQFNEH